MADVQTLKNAAGTTVFNVTDAGVVTGVTSTTTDTISESTAGAGVTIDSVLLKDGTVDLNGVADALILDADGNTSISAPTNDQIDIEVAGADDFTITANTFTALSGSVIATNTINETTAASGVTIDSLLVKDGKPLHDDLVKATIAVADASGGVATAALTVDLTRADGSSVLAGARQIMIRASASGAGQYSPVDPASEASLTFGTATKGSIIATAAGWCLAETDADGEFDCTATNTDDEGLYFWVETAKKVSDLAKACLVIGSNSDLATWSA